MVCALGPHYACAHVSVQQSVVLENLGSEGQDDRSGGRAHICHLQDLSYYQPCWLLSQSMSSNPGSTSTSCETHPGKTAEPICERRIMMEHIMNTM